MGGRGCLYRCQSVEKFYRHTPRYLRIINKSRVVFFSRFIDRAEDYQINEDACSSFYVYHDVHITIVDCTTKSRESLSLGVSRLLELKAEFLHYCILEKTPRNNV